VAKVAIAHKLAVRLYWMLRSGQDYKQVMERFARGAVRYAQWPRLQAEKLIGRPASLAG
jgi:hypothetical protein